MKLEHSVSAPKLTENRAALNKNPRNTRICTTPNLFFYCNARSLSNKIAELQLVVKDLKPLFFVVVETWLNSSFDSSLLDLGNYSLFRKDRPSRGGGLLMAAMSRLKLSKLRWALSVRFRLSTYFPLATVEYVLSTHIILTLPTQGIWKNCSISPQNY